MTEAIHCIGCGAIIQTENPHELKQGKFIANVVFA